MQAPRPALRVALLDLNNGQPNQGMRCLRQILTSCGGRFDGVSLAWDEFDVRRKGEVPDLSYDIFLSSGGPGSPFDGVGSAWEAAYFRWLDALWSHNMNHPESARHLFLICHSLQMAIRHFEVAEVTERRTESFGIFPVHLTEAGLSDPIFAGLRSPLYAADFRSWQIVQPEQRQLGLLGAEVLAREKIRPHVDLERAVMALRLSPHIVGTQFHPEADPDGMLVHFQQPARRDTIIAQHGEEKYARIIHRLSHPRYLARTHHAVLPNFLRESVQQLRGVTAAEAV